MVVLQSYSVTSWKGKCWCQSHHPWPPAPGRRHTQSGQISFQHIWYGNASDSRHILSATCTQNNISDVNIHNIGGNNTIPERWVGHVCMPVNSAYSAFLISF